MCSATGVVSAVTLAGLLASTGVATLASAQEGGYPHAAEPIGTVEEIYDGALMPDEAVATFRNIDRLFPTRTIKAGGKVRELPLAERQLTNFTFAHDDATYDLYDVMALDNFTALLVLKDGRIAFETYQRGNSADTRWMSMSVAKSITSTLTGIAIEEGLISGLDARVTDYVPALKGSAYDGVSVREVLMMASGVQWNETYSDPGSDRRALLRAQISQVPGSAMAVMAALPRAAPPGTVNNYSTGETQVLGEIVRGAVGKPLAEYLSEKIWVPYGMGRMPGGGSIRPTASRSAAAGSVRPCETTAASDSSSSKAG